MLRTLYTSLIRPHLDYACVIWNPHQLGDIRVVKRVQRSVTRACPSLRHLFYCDQLEALNLPTLLYRWRRMDMIIWCTRFYMAWIGYILTISSASIIPSLGPMVTSCTRNLITLIAGNTSFLRVINDWNSLPQDIIESENILTFKSKLDIFWQRFLNQAHRPQAGAPGLKTLLLPATSVKHCFSPRCRFLNIAFVCDVGMRVCVCVCVCVRPRGY